MRKLFSILTTLMLLFSNPVFADWDKTLEGATSISDIDTEITDSFTALETTLLPMRGWVNLAVEYASSATVTVTADYLWLQGTATIPMLASTVSETINIGTSGASGLDTLTESSSTWCYIWIIAKADGTVDGLLSTSSSSPTMPADYVYKTLVSAVYNNSSGDFVSFHQYDKDYWYSTWQSAVSGNLAAWQTVDISPYVPSSISKVVFAATGGDSAPQWTNISSTSTSCSTGPNKISECSTTGNHMGKLDILTANTLYWGSSGANAYGYIAGFEITKL